MRNTILKSCVVMAALLVPLSAQAQGVVGGAANGAARGNAASGPVGAVVGGAVGAVSGGVNGLLGIDARPRFHEYVVREHVPSYTYEQQVALGAELPVEGVTYYDVPPEYGVRDYRYTVINDHTVLVDPATHRIVQIVD
jgi:hypothetical protein